jgi:hypothetical protein
VPRPKHPFSLGHLVITEVPAGSVWHRLLLDKYPNPLGYGHSPSRFSDPREQQGDSFGVYYAGASFEVAFLEAFVRDRRNQHPGYSCSRSAISITLCMSR